MTQPGHPQEAPFKRLYAQKELGDLLKKIENPEQEKFWVHASLIYMFKSPWRNPRVMHDKAYEHAVLAGKGHDVRTVYDGAITIVRSGKNIRLDLLPNSIITPQYLIFPNTMKWKSNKIDKIIGTYCSRAANQCIDLIIEPYFAQQ